MSITWHPRELGMIVNCDGASCPTKYHTGNISATKARDWLKKHEGWGRGSLKTTKTRFGTKRHDLCPPLFSSRPGTAREGASREGGAEGEARRSPQGEDGGSPAAEETAQAQSVIDVGRLTLGGFSPRTGFVVLPGVPALWWKPCLTRETDSAREHCWFLAPTNNDSLYLLDLPIGARAVTRRRRDKATDPMLRACPSCGAAVGKDCSAIGNDGAELPRIPYASRLVHAARLEGATNA